jgi:SAM-dependent methyltransferase
MEDPERAIVESWHKNAKPWTRAVRNAEIPSRVGATDRAIVEAVLATDPSSVLDLGCGEGWLANLLAARGIRAVGIDAVPALIEAARAAGAAEFRVVTYQGTDGVDLGPADTAVCNFALFGDSSTERVFAAVTRWLRPKGWFVVQTLHPVVATGSEPYRDGWRASSWSGFSSDFTDPARWYFRTLESWVALFRRHGMTVDEIREPVHPETGTPASVIFMARGAG